MIFFKKKKKTSYTFENAETGHHVTYEIITDLSAQKSSRSPHCHDDSPRLLPQRFGLYGLRFYANVG